MRKAFLLDRSEPSLHFLEMRNVAGATIQNYFFKFNNPSKHFSEGFYWLKSELTAPSFDDLTFAYKNQVFSVLVLSNGKNERKDNEFRIKRFLSECKKYNLLPCVFYVDDWTMKPLYDGWGLVDYETNKPINPEQLASNDYIEMSEWEIANFLNQIGREYLIKKGFEIDSFCSIPDVYPNIFFRNNKGKHCWLIVKRAISVEDLNKPDCSLDFIEGFLSRYDGYYIGVGFIDCLKNISETSFKRGTKFEGMLPMVKLYRGMACEYIPLNMVKIHSAIDLK